MSVATGLVVYGLLWWLVLFMVLPFGVRSAGEANEAETPGSMPGAPVRARIWLKFLVTTAISGVLWCIVYWFIAADLVSFRAMVAD
jgi:predicted secreted protein